METSHRCQSCGMPLGYGFYGTNADDSENTTYCRFCFQTGAFVEPNLTMADMIDRSVQHMTTELEYTEERARDLAAKLIPQLSRWSA